MIMVVAVVVYFYFTVLVTMKGVFLVTEQNEIKSFGKACRLLVDRQEVDWHNHF